VASPYASRTVVDAAVAAPITPPVPWLRDRSVLRQQLATQAFETSLPQLLRYADRSSMAWSREVRLPYLDRRVADVALSLQTRYLYADGVTKRILRDVGRGLVPEAVLARRDKVGFEPPQQLWLNDGRFREFIADVLLDPRAQARGLYDAKALAEDRKRGVWRDASAVWRALNTELWLRELVDSTPAAATSAPRTPAAA
jgi:asparagine synthase (glutamine-hydrolysing)